jgi:Uma2 family endonuclease
MTSSASSPVEQMSEWAAVLAEHMPNLDALVTEDDTPVDNIFSEKQQRLLVESLYNAWAGPGEDRPFLALANVGLFYAVHQPPLVPDVLVSLDVRVPADIWAQPNRSYLIWEYGKPPDVVVEIVSNQKGEEAERKLRAYAQLGVDYYVIFDPTEQLGAGPLRVYGQHEGVYVQLVEGKLPTVHLGVVLWQGVYEGLEQTWLRWCDQEGCLILTGAERAEHERQRAEHERQRAERLAAQLRALGVKPEDA